METDVTWTINLTQILSALSDAMDCVEGEIAGVSLHHGKRVSCMCALLGRELNFDEHTLFDLAACALLHDNALPEYLATEYRPDSGVALGAHCISGEANLRCFPLFGDVTDALLYHHENADGSGPFSKHANETPLFARLIHLADSLDVSFDLKNSAASAQQVAAYLREQSGRLFDRQSVELLLTGGDLDTLIDSLHDDRLEATMAESLPQISRPLTAAQIEDFSMLFAKIIDYKSSFTAKHSQGVAQKALRMADHYRTPEPERMQLLLAGALHDIGKVIIPNDILEKPGRLTSEEFYQMKTHPYATWEILQKIEGLENVTRWAAHHHEKLDGSGYPFGLSAESLDRNERLMACIDIYQAMTEARPYKTARTHAEAIGELNRLSELQQLDPAIIADIDAEFKA